MTRQTATPIRQWSQADFRRERIGMVYALVDPRDRQIRYVGYTSASLEQRLREHLRQAKQRRGRSNYHTINWLNSLTDQGVKPEIFAIEAFVVSNWQARERHWINVYRQLGCNLTNTLSGGGGTKRALPRTKGYALSIEQRAKLSAAAAKRFEDPQERKRLSEARKGRGTGSWPASRPRPSRTHCPASHEYTVENTVVYPGKGKQCRVCIRDRSRNYRARLLVNGGGTPQTDADMANAARIAEGTTR